MLGGRADPDRRREHSYPVEGKLASGTCLRSPLHFCKTGAADEGGAPPGDGVISASMHWRPSRCSGPALEIGTFLLGRHWGNLLVYGARALERTVRQVIALCYEPLESSKKRRPKRSIASFWMWGRTWE